MIAYEYTYLDVSVINITVKSHLGKSSEGLLMGEEFRYVEKMKKYPDLGPRFKPLVIESIGGWHNYSFDYIRTMAAHISSRTNKHSVIVLDNILRACSFALQRHQGTMLVRRSSLLFCITTTPRHHASSSVPTIILTFLPYSLPNSLIKFFNM
jgi:hypothetical protein